MTFLSAFQTPLFDLRVNDHARSIMQGVIAKEIYYRIAYFIHYCIANTGC